MRLFRAPEDEWPDLSTVLVNAEFQVTIPQNDKPIGTDFVQPSGAAFALHVAERAIPVCFIVFESVAGVDGNFSQLLVFPDLFHIYGMRQPVLGTLVGPAEAGDKFFFQCFYLFLRCHSCNQL